MLSFGTFLVVLRQQFLQKKILDIRDVTRWRTIMSNDCKTPGKLLPTNQIRKFSRGFHFPETTQMRSFAKIKPLGNGENTLSFTDVVIMPNLQIFNVENISFYAIRENKILAKISEFNVPFFCPVCLIQCLLKTDLSLNTLSQWSHLKGFSSLWIILWRLS